MQFTALVCVATLMACVGGQQQDVTYKIWEEQVVGTFVGNVARDSHISTQFSQIEFQKLQYSIPPTISKVNIDSKTSTIRTAEVIDREKICDMFHDSDTCTLNFDVSVYRVNSDGSYNLLRIIKVKIVIEDINDNAPVFPSNVTTLDVPENLDVGQVLTMSAAVDADTGINNTVQRYRLKDGMGVFEIHNIPNAVGRSSNFGIRLMKKLDRETKAFYELTVIAEDGGFPKLSGSVNILVKVTDVNDNAPRFSKTSFDAVVPEDAPRGSTVLTVQAEDADAGENGRVTYSFSSLTSSKVTECLAIGDTTGDIYLVKSLDYEKDRSFRFAVTVTDNGMPAKSAETSVQIWIQDVNDNAPQIDITLPSPYVKESIGVGNYIAHVSLSDADSSENSQITCSITNDHFMLQKFSDSDSIYTVILRSHLDYEKSRTELVNITCHDSGHPPLYNASVFAVHVQDINDNAPVFTRSRYQATIREDNHVGQFVTQVQAIDPDEGDNGNVTYSLSRNQGTKFEINPFSGVIKAVQVLDHEEKALYELVVVARDQGSVPISSSVTVTILVGDLNDNPPQFIKPYFEMMVQENLPMHISCGHVVAIDPDTEHDNHLRYKFSNNVTYSDTFAIDPVSGNIYTLSSLDRELKASYSLEVMVFDESEPSFYDLAIVTVKVGDENDNKPKFVFPTEYNNTFQFIFTQAPGRLLAVECQDVDEGENGTVRFTIIEGNDKGLFFMDAINGELMVLKRMNMYDAGSYRLVVLARDGGRNFLESRRDINVIILMTNGTASYLQEEESRANIAIVIALICITTVLAIAVLITICIIRRIDRERKQHSNVKAEEENIYKQQVVANSPAASPARGSYQNEIEKLKRKIRNDMSFAEEDDVDSSELTKSSFSTFRTATSDSDQRNLSNKLSPSDMNNKRFHYVDKGIEIGRLTSSPTRGDATSSTYQSGRGKQWSAGQMSVPSSVMKFPVEDATSHSSGSTSDSGRGASSEEGEGHGHSHTVTVAIGDTDRAHTPGKMYTNHSHLITFNSPRSPASSSSLSHHPMSTSMCSETAKKRQWGDTPTTSSSSGTTLSRRLSSDSPLHILGLSEQSDFKPNISFSDDSVTANATVGNPGHSVCDYTRDSGATRTDTPESSHRQTSYLNTEEKLKDVKHHSPASASSLPSAQRQKLSPSASLSDTSLTANISRIPVADSSARHGMFVDSVILTEPMPSARSTRYTDRHPVMGTERGNINNLSNNTVNSSSRTKPAPFSNNRSAHLSKTGLHVISSPRTTVSDTQNTLVGEQYSVNDVHDVLDEASSTGAHRDDDNTTTTSGSYTINADDLRQEIDQLFFNDIVV